MNPIASLIQMGVDEYLKKLIEQSINMFLQFLSAISGTAGQVLDMPVVSSTILYSQVLASTFLATKVAYEAWMTYVLRQNGDPDADPTGVLFRAAQAAAVVGAVPWLVKQLYQFGTDVAGDIAKLPGVDYNTAGDPLQRFLEQVLAGTQFPLMVAVAVIFTIVIFIIVLIQTFIRAAELAVVAVVGPFLALGITNRTSTAFSTWLREMLIISMAQAVQMYLIKVSFFSLTYFQFGGGPVINLYLFCGFLWVTYKSPAILKQYAYSTGVGKAAGGATQSIGSMVLMRKIMSKGM